jgi:hypothetical protein
MTAIRDARVGGGYWARRRLPRAAYGCWGEAGDKGADRGLWEDTPEGRSRNDSHQKGACRGRVQAEEGIATSCILVLGRGWRQGKVMWFV